MKKLIKKINIFQVCKSAISNDALRTYFRYMKEWENQPISIDNGISSNYKSIEWTKVRVQALHDLYEAAPLGFSLFVIYIYIKNLKF